MVPREDLMGSRSCGGRRCSGQVSLPSGEWQLACADRHCGSSAAPCAHAASPLTTEAAGCAGPGAGAPEAAWPRSPARTPFRQSGAAGQDHGSVHGSENLLPSKPPPHARREPSGLPRTQTSSAVLPATGKKKHAILHVGASCHLSSERS